MDRIIGYFSMETEALDDYDKRGVPIKKPGRKTLLIKNKHGDVLFLGEGNTESELIARLPEYLRAEMVERGMDAEKEDPKVRLARAARNFEGALAAFNPLMVEVKVRNSTDYIPVTSLEEPRKPPRITVHISLKTDEQVYP